MPPFFLPFLFPPFLLFFQRTFGQLQTALTDDDRSWPCVLGLCPDGITPCSGDFGCPPPNCDPSNPSDPVCEGSGCVADGRAPTGGKCGTFVNFNRKREGELCTKHSQCRAMFLCLEGKCRASRRVGAYTMCTVGGGAERRRGCPEGEECFVEGTHGEEGVCLKPTMDSDKFQLDERAFGGGGGGGGCANGNIGEEGGPCLLPSHSCHVPLMCSFSFSSSTGGCCVKTVDNLNGKGRRMPPQPRDPNCRDALESGETNDGKSKCVGKAHLCGNRIYRQLMREQCPKSCGYCDEDGGSSAAEDEAERNVVNDGRGETHSARREETVKVDPGAMCSDRKRPGRESDCGRLAYLCEESLYGELMRTQCPKTCGFC